MNNPDSLSVQPLPNGSVSNESRPNESGPSASRDAQRIALTITVCMLAGKLLQLDSAVYLALYPTIALTKGRDFSWLGLVKMFLPTLLAASSALVVSEVFYDHPFIIWTISLLFLDWMRRRATTPAKLGALLMPTFNWILIVVFAQHTQFDMPTRIHEILLCMLITIVTIKALLALIPANTRSAASAMNAKPTAPQAVGYQHRLVSLGLIGGGLAFLMMVDLVSATFCLVPVIAAATQFNREQFDQVVKQRLLSQVAGCALAVIFSLLLVGQQNVVGFYALLLGGLIFILARWMCQASGPLRELHGDVLLATLLPIQLYISNHNLGLESTYLRAWELAVTLGILFLLHQITRSRYEQTDHRHS